MKKHPFVSIGLWEFLQETIKQCIFIMFQFQKNVYSFA
ncbi:hypothetical protein B4168_0157 [Anoxybacillus flavithermus]|nr:hypothetical protein B4168_0157 [Anoxybacillus flavithermus]OAO88920.1 hypothetical protein GT23_0160 [Parageobacillus thermoglucosidasius]